jgi:D-alanyl-lipoteichoic acid acyltransferase DltB (MBOAT superfamily)
MLGTFKYFNFFMGSLQDLVAPLGWQMDSLTINVILPVGISFYTFQTMSYTIDIYRGKLAPERSLLDFALFVAFFPQLVAGPIERAHRLLPQITRRRTITAQGVGEGLWMIAWGYFLKVFVADNLAKVADPVFAQQGSVNGFEALMGVYAFNFQVFGDFAGYSSIAIGLARLMGVKLMINFRFPYFTTNPRDFWANWHISLSTWLRDYLYIPLGGSRKGEVRKYFNLFVTMLLGGLWHGAAWTFVVWGFFHSLVLIVHRLLEPIAARLQPRGLAGHLWYLVRVLFFFHVLCAGGMIFRCQSVTQIRQMAASILGHLVPVTPLGVYYGLQVLGCIALVVFVQVLQKRSGDVVSLSAFPQPVRVPLLLLIFYLLVIWGEYGAMEFIYFQF